MARHMRDGLGSSRPCITMAFVTALVEGPKEQGSTELWWPPKRVSPEAA